MAGKRGGLDYHCSACGRIFAGPHASKGYPRVPPVGATNRLCPRCENDARWIAARAVAAGRNGAREAWDFIFNRFQQNYPGGKRAPHLRRASLPNPYRSRSEPIKRARKARTVKAQRRRSKRGR